MTLDSPVLEEALQAHAAGKLVLAIIDDEKEVKIPARFVEVQREDLSPGERSYYARAHGNRSWDKHPTWKRFVSAIVALTGPPDEELRQRAAMQLAEELALKQKQQRTMRTIATTAASLGALALAGWGGWEIYNYLNRGPDYYEAGETIASECVGCPELVVLEAPSAQVGEPSAPNFAVARFEVTFAEYGAFLRSSGRPRTARCYVDGDNNYGLEPINAADLDSLEFEQDPDEPVVCVTWADAQAYIGWLNSKGGRRYRLLSEDEWEYAARANNPNADYASEDMCSLNGADGSYMASLTERAQRPSDAVACLDDGAVYTVSGAGRAANAFGLVNMIGNVDEWVQDCYVENPITMAPPETCERHVIRGGSWRTGMRGLRFAARTHGHDLRGGAVVRAGDEALRSDVGFRVATSDLRIDTSRPPE